ncbi:MAG: NUDIX domain-containing protein [Anaerolineaceae bacterium]|nr:NUDIX domain-containing protein [Anaerolineaceae bacterium]
MIERLKVLAYVTYGNRLLVFTHTDSPEAGIQVPGGSVEPDEPLDEAALREAVEETGLTNLRPGVFLGDDRRDRSIYGMDEIHHRHFYHVYCDEFPQETWRHYEYTASDRPAGHEPIPFDFYWVNLPDGASQLSYNQDAFIPQLIAQLGL